MSKERFRVLITSETESMAELISMGLAQAGLPVSPFLCRHLKQAFENVDHGKWDLLIADVAGHEHWKQFARLFNKTSAKGVRSIVLVGETDEKILDQCRGMYRADVCLPRPGGSSRKFDWQELRRIIDDLMS